MTYIIKHTHIPKYEIREVRIDNITKAFVIGYMFGKEFKTVCYFFDRAEAEKQLNYWRERR